MKTEHAEHTPGPWVVVRTAQSQARIKTLPTTDIGIETVAIIKMYPQWKTDARRMANARLIAAAPDLLEALEAIVTLAADHGRMNLPECAGMTRAAIAKAKGESPT